MPPDAVLSAAFAADGADLEITGRNDSLTFVNGVYAPLAGTYGDRPCYRQRYSLCHAALMFSSEAIRGETALAGQFVHLYYDSAQSAWVLFVTGLGVAAVSESAAMTPGAISRPYSSRDFSCPFAVLCLWATRVRASHAQRRRGRGSFRIPAAALCPTTALCAQRVVWHCLVSFVYQCEPYSSICICTRPNIFLPA